MMKVLKFVTILVVLIEAVQCVRLPQDTNPEDTNPQDTNPQDTNPQDTNPEDTNQQDSKPLFLTPYIENNDTATARLLSRVFFPELLFKDVESYAGFLTVNKTTNSNMFFWYFPARKNSAKAPLVQWLQGGPGGASLYGMFMENGPIRVNPKTGRLENRKYNWNEYHNVLYIDNPVGCGFSYTGSGAYLTNQADVAKYLLESLVQFYELFPEVHPNDFYLTGESYAGKYIPSYAAIIHENRNNRNSKLRVNLKGFAIGNGVTDPRNLLVFGDLAHSVGLIDDTNRQIFNEVQNDAIALIDAGRYVDAVLTTFTLINTPNSLFNQLTGFTSPFNFLRQHGYDEDIEAVNTFMSTSGIEKYLHVGNVPFVPFATPNNVLAGLINDIMQSVAPSLAVLLDSELYRVIIYNGQLDILAGPMGAQNYLSKLNFTAADEYSKAEREIWRVGDEIAGWFKQAGTLTELTVKGAGHMVPFDQPASAYDILERLVGEGF